MCIRDRSQEHLLEVQFILTSTSSAWTVTRTPAGGTVHSHINIISVDYSHKNTCWRYSSFSHQRHQRGLSQEHLLEVQFILTSTSSAWTVTRTPAGGTVHSHIKLTPCFLFLNVPCSSLHHHFYCDYIPAHTAAQTHIHLLTYLYRSLWQALHKVLQRKLHT